MSEFVVSFSHHNAPFDLLGRIALSEPCVLRLLSALRQNPAIREVACLSTCNRTEIYGVSDAPSQAPVLVIDTLATLQGLDRDELARLALVLHDAHCRRHLLATATGIESLIIGELEILGQVRRAIEMAEQHKTAGPQLATLFHRAVQVGRRARRDTSISRGNLSVASVAVGLIRQRLPDMANSRALVIGTGEVGRKVLQLLNDSGVSAMMLVNRTAETAQTLAEQLGCTPIPMERMVEAISQTDIVVCATGAPHHVVRTEMVQQQAPSAGCRILVDLSAPPNIDPAVAAVPGNVLITIADLQDIADRNAETRQQEIRSVEQIIDMEMNRLHAEPEARAREDIIREFRVTMEAIRSRHLAHGARRFAPEHRDHLDRYSRSLVSALLHGIVKNLDNLPMETPDSERELQIARKLLLLSSQDSPSDPE